LIFDLDLETLTDTLQAAVCIVGAGAAGITLAVSLARRGIDVLVLESGGREHEEEIHDLFSSEILGKPHAGIHSGRFRALGGTTTRWGGQILPLQPFDFEHRPWIDHSGWPLSYETLLPYFGAALDFEGLDRGTHDDAAIWQSAGLPPPRFGDGIEGYFSRWCPEPDFAKLYGEEIGRAARIRLVLHATVVAITRVTNAITAIAARGLSGRRINVRANRFIFCVGAIETPRLLLQPLADGSEPPWAASGILGGFFQDHPHVSCGTLIPRDRRTVHALFDNIYRRGLKYQPRIRLSEARQRDRRSLNAGGIVMARTARSEILHQTRAAGRNLLNGRVDSVALGAVARGALVSGPVIARQAWRRLVKKRAWNPDDLGFHLGVQIEQAPRSDSRVSLSREVDAFGMRRARLDWRLGQLEVNTVATFADTARMAFESTGLGELIVDPAISARSPEVIEKLGDQNHHMGTARMANTSADGIVDSNLRMFGTLNAWICSTAVFPTSGFSNPTHTLIALALRLCDFLVSEERP
jgi:choline dehydrogenase-like flavoprotein